LPWIKPHPICIAFVRVNYFFSIGCARVLLVVLVFAIYMGFAYKCNAYWMWFNPRQAACTPILACTQKCSKMRRNAHRIFHHVSLSPCPCVGKCKKDLKAVPDVTQHYPRPSVYSPLSRAFRGNAWDYEEGCRSKAEGCNRC